MLRSPTSPPEDHQQELTDLKPWHLTVVIVLGLLVAGVWYLIRQFRKSYRGEK